MKIYPNASKYTNPRNPSPINAIPGIKIGEEHLYVPSQYSCQYPRGFFSNIQLS